MDLGIDGRVAIVTGASRGIGRDVVERLTAEGAKVLMVARNAEALDEAAAAIDGDTATLAADVTDTDSAEKMIDACSEAFGAPGIIVNNAGLAKWRPLEDVPDDDWQLAWDLYVMAPMRLMRASIPAMAEKGWGRVVNVASTAGKRPSANMGEYSVAKAAQLSLSKLYADKHASDGVLVNAICPGPVTSEMWMEPGGLLDQSREMSGASSRDEALANAGSSRPVGRLATPAEVGAAIAFLCSEHASYVSGAAWSVDGGTVQVII